MKQFIARATLLIGSIMVLLTTAALPAYAAGSCGKGAGGLPIPTWYKYVPLDGNCEVPDDLGGKLVVLVMMGIFDIILFIAGFVAVVMVIWGGYKFLVSTGEPQKIAAARTTIINALVGLAITIIASQMVGFIAGRLT